GGSMGGGGGGGVMGTGIAPNNDTCVNGKDRRGRKKRSSKCQGGLNSGMTSLGSSSTTGQEKKPSKRIYNRARHGDDYFATWGFTESRVVENDTRGEEGIKVATWGKTPRVTSIPGGELDKRLRTTQVAKSEFYYEPRDGGPRGWDDVKDEALWNPRWRARLRRV